MLLMLTCTCMMMCKISRWNSSPLLRKLQKSVGAYFFMLHPVCMYVLCYTVDVYICDRCSNTMFTFLCICQRLATECILFFGCRASACMRSSMCVWSHANSLLAQYVKNCLWVFYQICIIGAVLNKDTVWQFAVQDHLIPHWFIWPCYRIERRRWKKKWPTVSVLSNQDTNDQLTSLVILLV